MKALLWLMLLVPAIASADVLVRSCDMPGAGCTKWTWAQPANVKAAQVNHTGAPFVR